MDALKNTIAKNLTAYRKIARMSQKELAHLTALTPACICQVEKGKRWLSTNSLVKVCDAMGVTLDQITGRTNSEASIRKNIINRLISRLEELK